MNQNRIYIGPPGSGKTYSAKKAVAEIIWENLSDSEKKDPKMKFLTRLISAMQYSIILKLIISQGYDWFLFMRE